MKFVLDTMGAPASSGGMRLYVEGVLRGWLDSHPEDDLTVLGGAWLREEFGAHPKIRLVVVPNDSVSSRMFGQFALAAYWFHKTRSSGLVSLSTLVSPFVPKSRRLCVIHDWRHLRNPAEFGRAQLYYRRLWDISVRNAGAVVAISEKTYAETVQRMAAARVQVIENGRDHARLWAPLIVDREGTGKRLVTTFGHFPNKRPELLLRGVSELESSQRERVEVVVLGARDEYREQLRRLAADLGIEENCTFPGFVSQFEYEQLIQRSAVIALVSSDEGFGLPVAEANYFGIPALVTSDSGLASIHKHGVFVAVPTPQSIAEALTAALDAEPDRLAAQRLNTWAETASAIRGASLEAKHRSGRDSVQR